jgi:peptidyl-prolyl cis-trans isomerase SurA
MKLKVIVMMVMLAGICYAQDVLDKIVAVVDNEIITESELEFQANLLASRYGVSPDSPDLRKQTLNSMIEEKFAYAQANIDSITVTDEDVDKRIDYQIQMFIQQYGSKERVEQVYGMSIEKIKHELRDDVRKNLMVQKLREKNFGTIEATRRDVEEFFNKYRDSLGVIPEKVKIAHIYRSPETSSEAKEKAREFAQAILDSIKKGVDFAVMAKKYSEDPGSAKEGGDLGFVKRGVFYPEFEAAAFELKPGELSEVVESPVGFHIIQLLEKRGESVHARHILIKIKADENADLKTIDLLTAVRDSIIKGVNSFAYYAKKYSEDEDTAPFGGDLGTFYLNQLDKSVLDIIAGLKPGEISFPKRYQYSTNKYGYHIVYLEERTPQHAPDLEKDYADIKKLADEYKRQQKYQAWIDELKSKIYYDIRL